LDTNMNVVLLTLFDLAGIFIRFRERVESFEVLYILANCMAVFWKFSPYLD
jgi:hypothetical protein